MSSIDINKCLPYVPAKSGNAIVPYHCIYSSIGGIIRYHGYKNLDLVMCKEYDFYYESGAQLSREQKPGHMPAVHCFTNFERNLLEIDKIGVHVKRIESNHSAQEYFEQALSKNVPLLVMLDQYYLPYYRFNFMHSHFFHMCILIGLDNRNGIARLIEYEHVFVRNTFMIEFAAKEVRLADFFNAFHSAGNTVYEFQFPETPVSYQISTIQRIIRMATDIMLDKNNYNDISAGINGIRALANDMLSWPKNYGKDMMKIFDPIQLQTLATQRKWFSTFLHSVSAILNDGKLRNCSNHLNEICENWVIVRNMLVKAGKKNIEETLPRLSKRILNISDEEEKCVKTLRGLVYTI